MIYEGIVDIALILPGEFSGKLRPKILEYARLRYQSWADRYVDLLAYWVAEDQTAAALELADHIVRFLPGADAEGKRNRHKQNPRDWTTVLNPSPRFQDRDYKNILEKGIGPLAEKEPFEVACLLIDVVAEKIPLGMHQEELEQYGEEDASEIWCRRLGGRSNRDREPDEAVVSSLANSCEKVFERDPDSAEALDAKLKDQRWKVFKRLRQHLYALYPNEQTKHWIRESILDYASYAQWEYGYEFQKMIRRSCDYFGEELLTVVERRSIFDAILSGPSKALYREWIGDRFTEELFEQFQHHFHRKQFWPFASVLFDEYATHFQGLGDESTSGISDEDYSPVSEVKTDLTPLLVSEASRVQLPLQHTPLAICLSTSCGV